MLVARRRARPAPRRTSPRARLVPALFTLGTALTFNAWAADATPPADPAKPAETKDASGAVQLEPVNVTGQRPDAYTTKSTSSSTRLDLSPRETPQSISVMTRQRMDDEQLTNLRQVLDNTAGIYSNAYDTERVLFYSRGFLITNLMYDGVSTLPSFNTGSIDDSLDTAPYERIEIIRGATGLMSGTGNPAATINLVRKHADSTTPTFTMDLTAGSWRNGRAEVDMSGALNEAGTVRGRFVGVAETGDSYQDLYSKKTYVLYGIVDADITKSTHLAVGVNSQNSQPRSNTWGSFPLFLSNGELANWPTSVTTSTNWAYWNRKTDNVFAELTQGLGHDWQLKANLSYSEYKENLQLFYVYGWPDPDTGLGLEPYAYKSDGKVTQTALDAYVTGPFDLFGRTHNLVLGYNGSRAKNTGNEYGQDGDLPPTPNFFQWNGSYPEPAWTDSYPLQDIKTDQDAAYVTARFSLADPLHVIAGARYQRWKVNSFYLYDTPQNSNYNFSKVVPYAGIVWDVSRDFSAFASYTGTFQPQTARNVAGQYLDPIDGTSYEIGVKGEHLGGRLTSSLTIFQTTQNNVAAPVLDPETGEPVLLPDGTAASEGVDGVRTRGFEFEVSGRITEDLQGTLGWTHYDMVDRSGQTFRTFIPDTIVRAFATWQPRAWVPRLTLGAGVNWQSATNTIVGAPDGPYDFRQGSLATVQVMARYQFTPNVSLQFNGNNVFDRKYFVLDQYDNSYYGPPANYSLTLRASFN